MKRQRDLIEAGYDAYNAGQKCEAPATIKREFDRAAWEQGWRSALHEARQREMSLLQDKGKAK